MQKLDLGENMPSECLKCGAGIAKEDIDKPCLNCGSAPREQKQDGRYAKGGVIYETLLSDHEKLSKLVVRLNGEKTALLEALRHCYKVFESQANRGCYPLELLPGKPEFLGKQGLEFITAALSQAEGR